MDRGTYLEYEGRPAVRFEREYPYPPQRLWTAVTEPGELAQWFPSHVAFEPRVGGAVSFSGDPHLEPSSGTVLIFDPPHRLAFSWGGDELHLELTAIDGGCRLTFVDVLAERGAAARNAAGWDICLTELDKALAGVASRGPHSADAVPFQPSYDAYVEAGLPADAEIPTGRLSGR